MPKFPAKRTVPAKRTILFQAPATPAAPEFSIELGHFDHDLAVSSDGAYDPYSADAPLLPNSFEHGKSAAARSNTTRAQTGPKPLSLSGAHYHDFDPQIYGQRKHDGALAPAPTEDFLKTPPSALFPGGLPKPPPQHPFSRAFEPPEWLFIFIHVALCVLGYPALLLSVMLANHRTIFWARLVVGIGCGAVGVVLGISLGRLAQRFLEAATWATLIHQSRAPDNPGIRMRDFASSSQSSASIVAALRLLWNRSVYLGTQRHMRKHYDSRPWSLYILFFLLMVIISSSLAFILGRVVDIEATIEHQYQDYYEIAIAADSSDADIAQATAIDGAFNDFALTWTLSPFSSHGSLPSPVSFTWENDTVYFAETTLSQLLPNGTGFGTFETNTTAASVDINVESEQQVVADTNRDVNAGVTLRYPRWGIRIHCAKFTDPNTILPRAASNLTYVFTPRDTLQYLFSSFQIDFPSGLEAPLNVSQAMQGRDPFPNELNAADIASSARFSDNGVAHSFQSNPISMGEDGKGFVSIETLLIRLNSTYAPNGMFLTQNNESVPDGSGNPTFIKMDAAVCLELYEPWVLETYNNSIGLPTTTRIVNKGNAIVDVNTPELTETNVGEPLTDPAVKRQLNSTNLFYVYDVAHGNSANQILKDNGRDSFYVPSPTLVSFTGGQGPQGYLELSADFFAEARAMADASNVLTYFAGSGQTLTRSYPDRVSSYSSMNSIEAAVVFAVVLVLGVLAGCFVPRLPLGVPRRGFELYSWMAAFYSHELTLDQTEDGQNVSEGLEKHKDLRDIKRYLGDLRFRYGVHV